jgi:hypothetical protein
MLPQGVHSHAPPFESLVVQFYPSSLAYCLHVQKFASLPIDIPLDITQAHIYSCTSLGVGTWLLTCPITLTFHLASTHFLTTLCTYLGSTHPIISHLS